MERASSAPTIATCTKCGGEIPIRLASALECPYCGAHDSVKPDLLRKLKEIRGRFKQRAERAKQVAQKRREKMRQNLVFVLWALPVALVVYLAFGLWMTWAIAPKGVGLRPVFELVRQAGGPAPAQYSPEQQLRAAWTFAFAYLLLGVGAFAYPLVRLVRSARGTLQARALEPVRPGAPPRCRCCLAELPTEGTVRHCSYCGADHLVADGHFLAAQKSLDEEISRALRGSRSAVDELADSLANIAAAFIVCFFCGLVPIASLVVMALLSGRLTPSPTWLEALSVASLVLVCAYPPALWRHWRMQRTFLGVLRRDLAPEAMTS